MCVLYAHSSRLREGRRPINALAAARKRGGKGPKGEGGRSEGERERKSFAFFHFGAAAAAGRWRRVERSASRKV